MVISYVIYFIFVLLWPPCVADADIIFSSCLLFFLFFFFSSPNFSSCRLDVYHTSTRGVALLQIYDAGLKCAARGSLEMQDAKIRHLCTIAQLCWALFSQLRHLLTLCSRCGYYIFVLFALLSSSFFPRLISAVADWMSTILLHMVLVWPYCKFTMQVWNVLHAAHWKYRMQKFTICAPSHNFVMLYLRN